MSCLKIKKVFAIGIFLFIYGINSFSQDFKPSLVYEQQLFDRSVQDYANNYYFMALSGVNELIKLDSFEINYYLLKARVIASYTEDYDTSIRLIDEALQIKPNNSLLLKAKVKFLIKKKEYGLAGQVLEEGFGTDGDIESAVLLSNILYLTGKPETVKASRYLLFSLLETYQKPELYEQIALTYANSNVDSTIYYYNKCISLEPANQKYYGDLASYYYIKGMINKAKNVINTGVDKSKEVDRLYYLLSQFEFYGSKDYESSLLYLNKAIKANPQEEYVYQRGVIYDSIGNYQLAFDDYQQLLINKPWESKYLRVVSNYYLNSDHYSETIDIIQNSMGYDRALEDSCADILMKAYFIQSQFDSAFKYVDYDIVKKDESFNILYLRALLYASHGQYENSLRLCENFKKNDVFLKDTDFKIIFLKSLISLLQKHYDNYYKDADYLYEKYKNEFVNGMKFFLSKPSDSNTKRQIVIESQGNDQYFVYVTNLEKKEYEEIRSRYDLKPIE